MKTWRRWTPDDVKKLRNLWGEMELGALAAFLGRTDRGVYQKAAAVGLPPGCPEEFESLRAASIRCGFSVDGLRTVLSAAKVKVRLAMSRPKPGERHHRWQIVERDAVTEAVEAWARTETPRKAAARLGVGQRQLRRRLRLAGLKKPRRGYWRIETEVIDRVMDQPTKGL